VRNTCFWHGERRLGPAVATGLALSIALTRRVVREHTP
jgi:hypothetical protein